MKVILMGMGCGSMDTMTVEAAERLKDAELIIGARRLVDDLPEQYEAPRFHAIDADEILKIILREKKETVCVLYSGDTGFYSGTRRLLPLLKEAGIETEILPGLSSVQLFSAKLGMPWQDWNLFSAHGADCNAVNAVMQGKSAFFLTGGALGPAHLCGQLRDAGLGDVKVWIGEDLSYETESIYAGIAEEAAGKTFGTMAVMLAVMPPEMMPGRKRAPGIPDDAFIRGGVPMTRQVVRAAILSKTAVKPTDVIWDIGAGTGSVSVELALAAGQGWVYAVECNEEGCGLIESNRRKFGAWNLSVIRGRAPETLDTLPVPDVVFIGGTKGEMKGIVSHIHQRNAAARICISAIALETLEAALDALEACGWDADVTQIAVSNTKKAGSMHLLTANNPIFLITNMK